MYENYNLDEVVIDHETMSDEDMLAHHVVVGDNDLREIDLMLSSFFSSFERVS